VGLEGGVPVGGVGEVLPHHRLLTRRPSRLALACLLLIGSLLETVAVGAEHAAPGALRLSAEAAARAARCGGHRGCLAVLGGPPLAGLVLLLATQLLSFLDDVLAEDA